MKSLKQLVAQRKAAKTAKKTAKLGPTTPTKPYIPEVQRVLDRLPSKAAPQLLLFVDVGAGYHSSGCHLNVKHRVSTHGGLRVHGWVVWQYPGFAQAEFHSVWEDNQGNIFDITPHRNGQAEVMFIPDSSLSITLEPGTGLDILYSAITSGPHPWYALGEQQTNSPLHTVEIPQGSELQKTMSRYGVSDLR